MKSKFARIYFVRHGEVKNSKGIVYGYLPLPLSLKGKKEARQAGIFLKDKNIAAIFSSPQKRAQETAKIISQVVSRGKIKVQTERDLREAALGHFFEKLTKRQINEKYPEIMRVYNRHPAKVKAGGEDLAKMAERMIRVVKKAIGKYPGRNLVLVSHRNSILAALLKVSRRNLNDLHRVKSICGTGSMCEIDIINKRLVNKTYLAP